MSREFKIRVTERVSGYRYVWYTCEADSFEEAEQIYEDGYAQWYDSDYPDDWDGDGDEDLDEIECLECGECDESSCDCVGEDDSDEEAPLNPDRDEFGARSVEQLSDGMVVEVADSYTSNYFPTTGPVKILDIEDDGRDSIRVTFINCAGREDYWHINSECRFKMRSDAAEEIDQAVAAYQAERAAERERARSADAVTDLLAPVTGGGRAATRRFLAGI